MKKILDEGACYKIRFANRLDMNTSGLLIVAKNGFVQDQIIHQMKAGHNRKKIPCRCRWHHPRIRVPSELP